MRDMKDVYLTRLKRQILISCTTALIGFPCLGGLLWFIINVLAPGMENQDFPDSTTMIVTVVSASVVICVAIPLIIGWVIIKRRARLMDEFFLPMGFSGRMYMLNGRQYHRRDGKRDVDVYFFRGPTIEIQISAPVEGEFRAFYKDSLPSSLAAKLNTEAIVSNDPELLPYAFYPATAQWLPDFLEKPTVAHAIHELMSSGADWVIFRRVELHSGKLELHLSQSRNINSYPLDQFIFANWLRQLNFLADELEAAGLPAIDAVKLDGHVKSRQALSNFLLVVIAGIIVGLPLCAIATMVIIIMGVGNG